MARETIIIELREAGTARVASSIKRIGESASASESLLSTLRRALLLVAAGGVVHKILDVVSAFQSMENRIRLVTDSQRELTAVTDALLETADQTYTSFNSTAELYARLAFSTRELGVTQAKLLTVVKAVNQGVILSGANVREATAAVIQFTQGLASGTLRGDELRSVLEQLPYVADLISRELGVTRGALRGLAAEGKVTSEAILEAFLNAAEKTNDEFAKVNPTIGQSFQVIYNSLLKQVKAFDEATGAGKKLSDALLLLASNMPTVIALAATATTVFIALRLASYAAATSFAAQSLAWKGLSLAIATNPIGALIVATGLATAGIIAFGDSISVSADKTVSLKDAAKSVASTVAEIGAEAPAEAAGGFQVLLDVARSVLDTLSELFGASLHDIIRSLAAVADTALGIIQALIRSGVQAIYYLFDFSNLLDRWKSIWNSIVDVVIAAMRGIASAAFEGAKYVVDGVNGILSAVNSVSSSLGGGTIELAKVDSVIDLDKIDKAFNRLKTGPLGASWEDFGEGVGKSFVEGFSDQFNFGLVRLFDEVSAGAERSGLQRANPTPPNAGSLSGTVPGADPEAKSKNDIVFEQLRRQLSIERELLGTGQVKGKLEFNQKSAAIRLNQKLIEDGINLTESQARELHGLVAMNEELKLTGQAHDELADFTNTLQDQLALLKFSVNEREVEADVLRAIALFQDKGLAIDQARVSAVRELASEYKRAKDAADITDALRNTKDGLKEQGDIAGFIRNEREVESEVLRAANLYKKQGLEVDKVQLGIIRTIAQATKDARDYADITDEIERVNDAYRDQLRLLSVGVNLRDAEAAAIAAENIYLSRGQKINSDVVESIRKKAAIAKQARDADQISENNASTLNDLSDQYELLKLNTQEREIQAALLPTINQYLDAGLAIDEGAVLAVRERLEGVQSLANEQRVLLDILGDQAQIEADISAIQSLRAQGKLTEIQSQRALLEAAIGQRAGDTSVVAGLENGLDRLILKVTDFAAISEELVTNAYAGMEDALVGFVTTGEISFKKLVDSMLADLTRLLTRQAFSALFSALGGDGGLGSVLGGLAGARAEGGPVTGGRTYLVGEEGPELFTPPGSGTIVPNGALGSAPAQVTVVNVMDPSLVSAALADPRNQQLVVNFLTSGANRAKLRSAIG